MLQGKARVVSLALLLLILAATAGAGFGQDIVITDQHVEDELIIKFKPHATEAEKEAILADLGAYNVKNLHRIKAKRGKIGGGLSVANAIGRYRNHPSVEYIEPNYIVQAVRTPNDPRFDELWGLLNTGQTGGTAGADISATNAWDVFTGSDEVIIAVIDTGIDYNHPDLAANMWINPGEIPGNGIDDDGNGFIDDVYGWDFINRDNDPMDDNGHGTHCAGTIGAVGDNGIGVAGVNWNVKLMALKFLSAGGSGSTADAIEAIQYATMMGAHLTSNSWGGGGYSQAMYDAIADAQAAGILFVAAAGNSGSNTDVSPSYPSAYPLDNIVAVAATDHNDALASFSSYGATTVDLAAPGVSILSTLPGNRYGTLSGTSMATPHVAGALGLIFGRFPAIGGPEAKSLLLNFTDPLPSLDGRVLTGGRLNAFMPIADPDSIPPGPIMDLAVATAGSNWLELAWTATGDDDYEGRASRYDLRWSTAPIDEGNWAAASQAIGEPDPSVAGTPESFVLHGLDFNTVYYVAIKALDEFGNASPVSNSPLGQTLGAPDLAVSPGSLAADLLTGDQTVQTLTLSNVGEGTLDFVIPLPTLLGAPTVQKTYEEVPKGEDPRIGEPVTAGAGGPDAFGYRWIDSNDPMGPVFAWEDISGHGNVALTSGDDVNVGPFPISFPFKFYGAEHEQFRICSNGFLSLTSTATAYSNQQLPNPGAPAHLIAPFWDDLILPPGTVYWHDDGTRLIVQWEGVGHYGTGGPYSFQAILGADGSILYQYNSMAAPTNSATVGIQNGTGTDGLQVVFNAPYVTDGLAVRIWAIPQWVTVAPSAGTVWAPGSLALDVTFDASGLVGGTYDGIIRLLSNDPDEPEYHVPVTLGVTGAPDIEVSPLLVAFGDLFLGATLTQQVVVRNAGTDDLTITGIAIDEPAFTADADPFTLTAGAARVVEVTFTPAEARPYAAAMAISSDDPTDPLVSVSLTGAGLEPPDYAVTPTSLTADLMTGESEQQTLTFTNSGGADFEFDLSLNFHAQVTVHEYVEVGKDEVDLHAGEPVTQGSGGPDNHGYRWVDSNEPGGPAYSWTDISATGTAVFTGPSDDRNAGPFPIGFDFPYYGNAFNSFRVCSNGWLSFTSTSTALSNQMLPNTGAPENLLAVFWDDLNVTTNNNNVYYLYDGMKLIVQFHQVPRYGSGGPYTFQALLYPDGTIVYQYASMLGTRLNEATIGIQNDARDDGLTVVHNAYYVEDGLAIRFQAFPEWLTVQPTSGVVPPGGSLPVTARFNATGLFGGTYLADIVVSSNDPAVPTLPIPATLLVTGAPDIAVSATEFDFGTVYLGTPTLRNLIISNIGTDNLNLTDFTISHPDFNANLMVPTVLGPTQSLIVTVGFVPSAVGLREGTLTLVSNDPDQPALDIALSGIGLEPPQAVVSPTSLAAALLTGELAVQTLTMSNTGHSDLEWTAHTMLGAADMAVHAELELDKDQDDPRPGILGSGGPDLYGYRWKDSNEPGGPVFTWTDISGTGTPVFTARSDDTNRGPFPVGFNFPFYGVTFNSFRVCSNGFLSFTSTSTAYTNQPLPGTGAPENLIAPFWDDLVVDPTLATPNNVYYEYDGSKLIVQFDGVMRFSAGGPYTFQVHLYPNGAIFFYYQAMQGATLNSATIGIQNATRDDGLMVAYNTAYVQNNLAVRIAPVADWLSINPAAGTVAPGATQPIQVTFNAAELFGGTYDGAVILETNDPRAGLINIPATLHVTGVPVLAVSPAALSFGDVYIGFPEALDLTVTNAGTDLLTVTGIAGPLGDFTAVPTAFNLDPFESRTVTVTFAPAAAGLRSDVLAIASNDAASPAMVPVDGVGIVPPDANWSPDMIVGAAMPGGMKIKTMTLCNDGGSDLIWTLNGSASVAAAMVAHPFLDLGKDEADPRPGLLGSGGPDTFGYTWIDSDDPGGPTFSWTDISGIGTPTFGVYSDDGNRGPFPIGFDFSFYGNTFDSFRVCSNGFLSFTSTSTAYSNQPLPNAGAPENLLAAFWDDMVVDPSYNREIYYYHDGQKLIVQFDLRRIAQFSPPFYSFQALLYPNGNIVYQYNVLGPILNSATIGIQNSTRDDGLNVVFNAAYVHEGLAILFSTAPSWLSVGAEGGVLPAGECLAIDVIMDAAELEPGDYQGTLTLTSNDPADPVKTMDVLFHVGTVEVAAADVDPSTLNLSSRGKWITGMVELLPGYDPQDVLIETVLLNGSVAADPVVYSLSDDFNENGIPDLMFKFSRSALEGVLPEGEHVEVVITGEIRDLTYFVARDTIRVIRPTVQTPNGGEVFAVNQPIAVSWENPVGWNIVHADLFYTLDGGETWELIAEGVTGTTYSWTAPALPTETARIRVFIYDNRGVLGYDSSDEFFTVTDVVSDVGDVLPVVYALWGAYPNPFNPKTIISFDLPQDGMTRLTIFDLRGRLVRTLIAQQMLRGRHEAAWIGDDDHGRRVSSGVYYYRLQSGEYTATKSMTLIK